MNNAVCPEWSYLSLLLIVLLVVDEVLPFIPERYVRAAGLLQALLNVARRVATGEAPVHRTEPVEPGNHQLPEDPPDPPEPHPPQQHHAA